MEERSLGCETRKLIIMRKTPFLFRYSEMWNIVSLQDLRSATALHRVTPQEEVEYPEFVHWLPQLERRNGEFKPLNLGTTAPHLGL